MEEDVMDSASLDDSSYILIHDIASPEEIFEIPQDYPRNAVYLAHVPPGEWEKYAKALIDFRLECLGKRIPYFPGVVLVSDEIPSQEISLKLSELALPWTHPDRLPELKRLWIESRKRVLRNRAEAASRPHNSDPEPYQRTSGLSDEDIAEWLRRAQDPRYGNL
ncbi:MAG: hypothetical protein Q7S19_03685 [bacterium]|nr:hypothetical protein [bacterium]